VGLTPAPTYFQTLEGAMLHPIAATESLADSFSSGFIDSFKSLAYNALGNLSPTQKTTLIANQTASVVAAGGDPADAAAQAAADVQGVLDQFNADPSTSPLNSFGSDVWILIAIALAGIFLYGFGRGKA
jgi:hypothetical protein